MITKNVSLFYFFCVLWYLYNYRNQTSKHNKNSSNVQKYTKELNEKSFRVKFWKFQLV